jgi:hypothetical protein
MTKRTYAPTGATTFTILTSLLVQLKLKFALYLPIDIFLATSGSIHLQSLRSIPNDIKSLIRVIAECRRANPPRLLQGFP